MTNTMSRVPRVAVIMINYNGFSDTRECLESMYAVKYPNYRIFLVDNGSVDGEADMLEELYGKTVTVIRSDKNLGFTGGNNTGVLAAKSTYNPDYYLFLNNDTTVDPWFIDWLVRTAEYSHKAGAVVGKIMLYDDPVRIESTGLNFSWWRGQSYRRNFRHFDNLMHDPIRKVDGASTNAFMVRREAVEEVGLFDESFFIYHDDIDYCIRLRQAGYDILYVPMSKIYHKVGASTKSSGMAYYYLARNNLKLMRKHTKGRCWWRFLAYFLGFHIWAIGAIYLLYHRRWVIVRKHFEGVWEGIRCVSSS